MASAIDTMFQTVQQARTRQANKVSTLVDETLIVSYEATLAATKKLYIIQRELDAANRRKAELASELDIYKSREAKASGQDMPLIPTTH